jgi:hypothetical protein
MKELLSLLLFAPSMLIAQSPFDGTWMTRLDTAQFPKKPDKYLVDKGTYHCLTCVPKVDAKADGTDQKVTGHPYFDTISIHIVDPNTVEVTQKKDGRISFTETDTVSSDGNTMTAKFVDSSEAKPVDGKVTYTRVDKGPAGANAVSGSWSVQKVDSVSSNGLSSTYQSTADGLKWSDPNGASYDAKFDGKDYPIEGDPGHTMVSLKRIDKNIIEETDKRNGKVVGVSRMTVSKDGKSMKVEFNDKERGTTTTYLMEKQS